MSDQSPSHRHPLMNKRLGLPIMAFAAFGMLFWMKLKLSVEVPRVAYAEPEPVHEPRPALVPTTTPDRGDDTLTQDGPSIETPPWSEGSEPRRPNDQD